MLAVAAIVLHPFVYIGMYAGDAEIHLSYARMAAAGHFFEFNPGEATPGVTSPGYMLLLACLFRVFPETSIPIIVKALNIACWYAMVGC